MTPADPQDLTPQKLDELMGVAVTPKPIEVQTGAVWMPRFTDDTPPF